jgi:hypothetical protein
MESWISEDLDGDGYVYDYRKDKLPYPTTNLDDGDGIPNFFLDTDDDGDGVSTRTEIKYPMVF